MGRLLANSESFDFRSAGERADKSEDLQMHSFLMLHNLVEGSGPLRRLRGEGHQASRITSVKWVRRPAAAAGPPSNTPRNYIKNRPGGCERRRPAPVSRPTAPPFQTLQISPARRRTGLAIVGTLWKCKSPPSPSRAQFRAVGFGRQFFVLVKSGPAKLGLAGPVRKF